MDLTKLDLRFAVVGALIKNAANNRTHNICAYDVRTYCHYLEKQTGLPVINGFRQEQIEEYLENTSWLKNTGSKGEEDGTIYHLNEQMLEYQATFADFRKTLLEHFDPPLNYPIKLLQAARIM